MKSRLTTLIDELNAEREFLLTKYEQHGSGEADAKIRHAAAVALSRVERRIDEIQLNQAALAGNCL